jgi:hypothetical protein
MKLIMALAITFTFSFIVPRRMLRICKTCMRRIRLQVRLLKGGGLHPINTIPQKKNFAVSRAMGQTISWQQVLD